MGKILAGAMLVLILLGGCNDKKTAENEITVKKTIRQKSENNISKTAKPLPIFKLKDIDERELQIIVDNKDMKFQNIDQPFVLVNFFATWCLPCKSGLQDINQLQQKYSHELFVAGVLVGDMQNSLQLREFMKQHKINYFISHAIDNNNFAKEIIKELGLGENISIPLTLLYKNGKLYRYYEGAMPLEMIENELQQAKKKEM